MASRGAVLTRLTPIVLTAVLVLGCSAQPEPPPMTPTAEMAVYCMDEPLGAYETGRDEGVAWAIVRDELHLHFLSAKPIEIPPNQPSCGQDWWLTELAGEIQPILSDSYSVFPGRADDDSLGFVMGFGTSAEIRRRLDFLRQCASDADGGGETDPMCNDAAVVLRFGPADSPPMRLVWQEDERLIEWLTASPAP